MPDEVSARDDRSRPAPGSSAIRRRLEVPPLPHPRWATFTQLIGAALVLVGLLAVIGAEDSLLAGAVAVPGAGLAVLGAVSLAVTAVALARRRRRHRARTVRYLYGVESLWAPARHPG